MKKIFLLIIFISYFISNGITQEYYEMEKDEENNKEEGRNILYGFYFGELFSGGYGRIGFKLEPFICYRPVYRFRLAAGPLYNFEKKSGQAARHAYGADVFSEIIFIKKLHKVVPVDLLAHAEYQVVSLPKPDDRNNRPISQVIWVGPGISQPVNKNVSLNILLLWKVYHINNIQRNPFWKFSVVF